MWGNDPPSLQPLGIKSRKKPRPGDVFTMRTADGLYAFGRVVDNDAHILGVPGGLYLVYIYDHLGSEPSPPPLALMRPPRLMFGPRIINRTGWTRGYFETITHIDLTDDDVIRRHLFRDLDGSVWTEHGERVRWPRGPVQARAVGNFLTIGDAVAQSRGD